MIAAVTTILLLLLLLPGGHAVGDDRRLTYSMPDARIACTATGRWDAFYQHYHRSCEQIKAVTCVGRTTSAGGMRYHWTCALEEEVEGYHAADVHVAADHTTVHVRMAPDMELPPPIYVLLRSMIAVIIIVLLIKKPASLLAICVCGAFAGTETRTYEGWS